MENNQSGIINAKSVFLHSQITIISEARLYSNVLVLFHCITHYIHIKKLLVKCCKCQIDLMQCQTGKIICLNYFYFFGLIFFKSVLMFNLKLLF